MSMSSTPPLGPWPFPRAPRGPFPASVEGLLVRDGDRMLITILRARAAIEMQAPAGDRLLADYLIKASNALEARQPALVHVPHHSV